jgi:aryl-alcohol dehydrogenase-like predicted oxidoreductase
MEYRQLGRTGVKVSPICLGCMNFGGKTQDDDAYAFIDHAIDAGINFLDTANVYNRGKSEIATGEALKRNGKRDHIVLATKVHGGMDDHDPNASGNSRRHIIQQCEASLQRLQTDWIDLYQIHRPQSSIPIDETLRALDDLIRAGKVRYAGTSTFAAWQVVESLWVSKEMGLNRFVCEQPPLNILDRRIERELLPMAQTYGIATIPWSPLAGGLLTGKYRAGQKAPAGSRFEGREEKSKRWNETVLGAVEKLIPVAERLDCTLSQLSLRWCMDRPGVTSPIIGPRTLAQLEDNLGALSTALDEEALKAIDEIVPPGQFVAPFYDADFGPHLHRV